MNSAKYWIALEQSHGIGPAHLLEVYEKTKQAGLSLDDLYDLGTKDIMEEFNLPEATASAISNLKTVVPKIDDDYSKLLESGIETVLFFSDRYPARLHKILGHKIPSILYTFGNIELLKMNGVAVLGDKDVSDKGGQISYEAGRLLAAHGIGVVSGFAQGVDLMAHRSALTNNGKTVAFVPYGMFHLSIPPVLGDVFNPERILIVSVFYPSAEANRYNAYMRNRIICAFSRAVYIVEAPSEEGIFEAAKSAKNLNVPLFTTKYAAYPKNADGNKRILEEMGGIPVLGRMESDRMVPDMDRIIGAAKFDPGQ